MEKEYQFIATVQKCRGCGLKLAGKKVEVGGWRGTIPMGYCPKCGTAYPLVEIESEPEQEVKPPAEPPEPEPKVESEPEPEPGEEPPAEEE